MSEDIWKKISRIKNFDSIESGFIGYCQVCKENVDKGKEFIIEKDGLREWMRMHTGTCIDKFMKLLKKKSK